MTRASFWRRLPAAALRAFVKRRSPAAACRRLSSSNAASGMNTSPRTSSCAGMRLPFSRSGTAVIVRRFSVTFSPVRPSPRVAPIVNRPSSYCSEIARPSSLGSATKRIGSGHQLLDPRAPREELVAGERVVEREHRHAVLDRRERGGRPAARPLRRRVGSDELGMLLLERAQLADQRVELRVGDLGRVEHEVLLVVVLDQLAELLHPLAAVGLGSPRPAPDRSSSRAPRRAIYRPGETGKPVRRRWRAWWPRRDRARGRRSRGRAASTRSAWLTPWPASPHAGATSACERSRDGSQPRRVSSHHTSSSAFQIGAACSPTGRSVGIAPQITQPPPSRKRESVTASSRSSAPMSKCTSRGPASSARRRSPRPHTCTAVRHEGAASAVERMSVASSRSRGVVGPHLGGVPANERGLVEAEHERGVREAATRRAPRAHGPTRAAHERRASNATFTGNAGLDERDAERERPGALHLHPPGRRRLRGGDVEEREQAAVRERVERRVDRARAR